MSSRSRMMGAGNASSTSYKTNVNLNTFGGNKKQGITSRVGLDNWANVAVQTYSNGIGRNKLFCMNQLGGVGAGKSMFNGRFSRADGVNCNELNLPDTVQPDAFPAAFPYYTDTSDSFVWFPNPYLINTGYTVTIVTNTVSNTSFQAVSYPGPAYSEDSNLLVNTPLNSYTTVTFTVPPEAGRYVSLQLRSEIPNGSFNIQSFKINAIEQLPTIPYLYTPSTPPTPAFPYNTHSGSDSFVWFPDPYLYHDIEYTVTIVTNAVSNTAFQAVSYAGPVFSNDNYILQDEPLTSNDTVTFTVPPVAGRYVSLQLQSEISGGSFNIQSFKINNVEQLTTIPYIYTADQVDPDQTKAYFHLQDK
jgi:hypothetical protein